MHAFRHCDSMLTQKPTNAAFQLYSTCIEHMVSVVPDSLPLSKAVVLPVSVDTAIIALYIHLELPLPSLRPSPIGKKILIWGGSSSVGCSAIQFAVASGLEVVATASRANHDFVKSLGATHVFDYKDPSVVDQLINFLEPGDFIMDCISTKETETTCAEILGKIGGGKLPVVNFPQGTYPENVQSSFGEFFPSQVQKKFSDILKLFAWMPVMPPLTLATRFGTNLCLRLWLPVSSRQSQILKLSEADWRW